MIKDMPIPVENIAKVQEVVDEWNQRLAADDLDEDEAVELVTKLMALVNMKKPDVD